MKKDTQVLIKLSSSEKAAFERAAEIKGMAFSAWARMRMREAAELELKEKGEEVAFLDNR
jgi:hypothetical protein